MIAKILIIDDEPNMIRGLSDNLLFEGYEVSIAADGVSGLDKIRHGDFDLVLLDVMMPEMSGFEVCKKVRSDGNDVPIIFLTAKSEEIDKVIGFELGSDDYITKPFSVRELLARVKAVLRRKQGQPGNHSQGAIQIGKLSIDFTSYSAKDVHGEVKMSHKEFAILQYLSERKNETVTRHDLLEKVWGYDETPTTRTVDNFMVRLRHKIEADPNSPKFILTVHGTGYKLILP